MEPLYYFISVNLRLYSSILLPQKKHFSIPHPYSQTSGLGALSSVKRSINKHSDKNNSMKFCCLCKKYYICKINLLFL